MPNLMLLKQRMKESGMTIVSIAEKSGISSLLLTPVLKCVGIALVTELGAQLCKDASQAAAAAFVELCGSLCALYVALPLISSLVSVVEGLL